MQELLNQIFLGCNYNDKKIKSQIDNLKIRLEKDTPLSCVIIDKRGGKSARDLWRDIKDHIEQSAACVFDLTGFRPNVVLELGYALSIKSEQQVFITFRKRKSKGRVPKWLLSDISHLQRFDYISIHDLESHVRDQLAKIPYSSKLDAFAEACKKTNAEAKYRQLGLLVLQKLRDEGNKSDQQLKSMIVGSACRVTQLTRLLKKERLVVRSRGRNGKYSLPISEV